MGCGGCKTGRGQYTPATHSYDTNLTADVVVVAAQTLRETALGVFDSFMKIEKANEAALKSVPGVHQAAEEIRKNGSRYLDDLTAATTAYQNSRTPGNADRLKSALAAVSSAVQSAVKHLALATQKAP